MGFLVLVLCVSLSSLVFCREGSQEPRRATYDSPKIDLLCFNGDCVSNCGPALKPFCLDARLSETSPSYILNDRVLFMRAQLVLETNVSVVGLIQRSFSLPASFFTPQTLELSPARQITDPSLTPFAETFSELTAMDSSLSGLKVGDPYCVWQKPDPLTAPGCVFSTEDDSPLDVPTAGFPTGHFGFSCSVKRFEGN